MTAAIPLARRDARLWTVAALQTIEGLNVLSPGVWDSVPARFPEAKVRAEGDSKTASAPRGAPTYTTSISMAVQLHVRGSTEDEAQDRVDLLCAHVERVVFGDLTLMRSIQKIDRFVTRTKVDGTGKEFTGWALINFEIEVFETFDPVSFGSLPPLDGIDVTAKTSTEADPVRATYDLTTT